MSETMGKPQTLSPWAAITAYADYVYFNDAENVEECQKYSDCMEALKRPNRSQAATLIKAYWLDNLRTAVVKRAEHVVLTECAAFHSRQSKSFTMSMTLRKEHIAHAHELNAKADKLRKAVNHHAFRADKALGIMKHFI